MRIFIFLTVFCLIPLNVFAQDIDIMTIDIQGGFDDNNVTLFVNGVYIWSSDSVKSDNIIDFVESLRVPLYAGSDRYIKVIVDGAEFSSEITDKTIKFIGIQRTEDKTIEFNLSKQAFFYD